MLRQEIIALEGFVATEFVTASDPVFQVVPNLRLLGKFYAMKFTNGNRQNQDDYERAFYYLNLGLQKSGRDFRLLNDLGWLHSEVAPNQDLDQATRFLSESLKANEDQQRALYNLGTIAIVKDKWDLALAQLSKASQQPNWETEPNAQFSSYVHYNLACVCSR